MQITGNRGRFWQTNERIYMRNNKRDVTIKHLQPPILTALNTRVSSDRQEADLSGSAQMKALNGYARANGYSFAHE